MRNSRVLCLLLCSCFICGVLCIPASASDTLVSDSDADVGIAPFSIVGTGSQFSWSSFVVGSVTPVSRVTVDPGTLYSSGPSSGSVYRLTIGQFELGAAEVLQTGSYLSSFTLTEWVPVQEVHKSLSGVVRYTLEVGSNLGGDSTMYVFPSSVELEVIKTDKSTVIWSGSLVRNGEDFVVNVDIPEQTVGYVRFTVSFNSATKSSTEAGQVRSVAITGRTTLRWDGATQTSEDVGEILEGVNQGNYLQSQANGLLSNIMSGITSLPSKIADAIKGLFVPSQDDLTAIKGQYEQLLSERLGFVWQAGDMVTDFFSDFLGALQDSDEYEFVFPGIAFPMNGELVVICEEMTVDLDNDVMAALRSVLGTIVTIISVLGFINVASDMAEALISGKSYHDFLHRKEDDG